MKLPKLPKIAFPRRSKKLHATTASRRAPATDDYYDEEPKTNLSSAFVVVLILHVVAVGGIYAFNSIKAARRGAEAVPAATAVTPAGAPLPTKASAPAPERTTDGEPVAARGNVPAMSAANSKDHLYVVKSGDNLTKIAAAHDVTIADLEEANGIKNVNGLRAGDTLTIPPKIVPKPAPAVAQDPRKAAFLSARNEPAPATTATPQAGAARTYVVKKDDTATSIARRFGTTADQLLKLNKIEDPKKMQLGQTLKLPPAKKTN
jgi:LysM repeat protein